MALTTEPRSHARGLSPRMRTAAECEARSRIACACVGEASSLNGIPMRSARDVEGTDDRPLTAVAWLVWIGIATTHAYAVAAFSEAVGRTGDGPGAVLGGAILAIGFPLVLIPALATAQWLVLRNSWRSLLWPTWFGVAAVSQFAALATLVATLDPPVVGPFAEICVAPIAFAAAGLVAAAALNCQTRSRVIFAILFAFFFVGTAATTLIHHYWRAIDLAQFRYLGPGYPAGEIPIYIVAVAIGAAISGFGPWIVSQRAADVINVAHSRPPAP